MLVCIPNSMTRDLRPLSRMPCVQDSALLPSYQLLRQAWGLDVMPNSQLLPWHTE
jgi:hypothetical protein